jgi:lambda family phage portal protein
MTARVRIGRVQWKSAPPAPRPSANYSYDQAYGNLTSGFAYQADSLESAELGNWMPWLRSPDSELNFYRDRRVSRTRDLERNDGWARGAINRTVDNTIGNIFRLVPRPNWRALSRVNSACDAAWAKEFGEFVDSEWQMWADDPMHYCDVAQQQSMVQMFRLALRHKLLDGENLGVVRWEPDQVGPGAARYATALQLIDPDRLSNPYDAPDTHAMRGGVEINDNGAAIAFHIRRAHQNDMFDAPESVIWDRIPRKTAWGRPIVLHDFDLDRTGQHRGLGVLSPILSGFMQLTRYDSAEMAQALLQTAIGTFIESPYDPALVEAAMNAPAGEAGALNAYQDLRAAEHARKGTSYAGVRIPIVVPGEKVVFAPARHPSGNFAEFEHAALRKVAAAVGTTAEQITQDYSKANYSSLRAAMLDAWRTMIRRRADFAIGMAAPLYCCFLEELIDRNPSCLPRRAPDFLEMRAAYARARWIGPGRGWVDPVKERQGAVLGLDAGFGTLEDECAEISGADWRDQLEQRAEEIAEMERLKLPKPDWAAGGIPASETDARPQPA